MPTRQLKLERSLGPETNELLLELSAFHSELEEKKNHYASLANKLGAVQRQLEEDKVPVTQ